MAAASSHGTPRHVSPNTTGLPSRLCSRERAACVTCPNAHGHHGLVVKTRSRFSMRPRTRDMALRRRRMLVDPVLPGHRYMQIRCGEFTILFTTVHPGPLDLAYIRAILIFSGMGRALVCNCLLLAQEANGCRLAILDSYGGHQMCSSGRTFDDPYHSRKIPHLLDGLHGVNIRRSFPACRRPRVYS